MHIYKIDFLARTDDETLDSSLKLNTGFFYGSDNSLLKKNEDFKLECKRHIHDEFDYLQSNSIEFKSIEYLGFLI